MSTQLAANTGQDKRQTRNFLPDARVQLKFASYIGGISLVPPALPGGSPARRGVASGSGVDESAGIIERARIKNSEISNLKFEIRNGPVLRFAAAAFEGVT